MSKSRPTFRSDLIPLFRRFAPPHLNAGFAPIPEPSLVVVDANILVRTIKFSLKRSNPEALSTFEELVRAGVWIPISPRIVTREVRRALDRTRTPRENYQPHLKRILALVRLVSIPREHRIQGDQFEILANRDPKDLPYAWLFEYTKADFIITADRDLAESSLPVLLVGASEVDIQIAARDHIRLLAETNGRLAATQVAALAITKTASAAYQRLGPLGTLILGAVGYVAWQLADIPTKDGLKRSLNSLADKTGNFLAPLLTMDKQALELGKLVSDHTRRRAVLSLGDQVLRLILRGPLPFNEVLRRVKIHQRGVSSQALWNAVRNDRRLGLTPTNSVYCALKPRPADIESRTPVSQEV